MGVVSFHMANTGLPQGPPLLGAFPETNARLYFGRRHPAVGLSSPALTLTGSTWSPCGRSVFGLPYRWPG